MIISHVHEWTPREKTLLHAAVVVRGADVDLRLVVEVELGVPTLAAVAI